MKEKTPFSVKVDWTESGYLLLETIVIHSERYGKDIIAFEGDFFDGATGAVDVCPMAWIPHDVLCRDGEFADGTPCTNWEASQVLSDQLAKYNRPWRSGYWKWATFFFGGGKARKNGMI